MGGEGRDGRGQARPEGEDQSSPNNVSRPWAALAGPWTLNLGLAGELARGQARQRSGGKREGLGGYPRGVVVCGKGGEGGDHGPNDWLAILGRSLLTVASSPLTGQGKQPTLTHETRARPYRLTECALVQIDACMYPRTRPGLSPCHSPRPRHTTAQIGGQGETRSPGPVTQLKHVGQAVTDTSTCS